ncbi:MAG: DUF4364 family protein [Clostridiaceae bacterium]
MFENTLELAENKLLLLYIVNRLDFPVSNSQITELILVNNLMNYFTLQEYIDELTTSGFLLYKDIDGSSRLCITENGKKVLELFFDRISPAKHETAESYITDNWDIIKKELTITADYTIEGKNNFIVNLKATEKDRLLMDIKFNVASNTQARELCARWKDRCPELYAKITGILIDASDSSI